MKRFLDYPVVVVILLLALGQPARGAEWNPTASDAQGSTAGGTGALALAETHTINNSTAF